MEIRKMVTMTLYARQQKRHTYKEQTFGLGESGMICESITETCTLLYVK